MRAVWLEVPASFLEERRKLGHDKLDEVWDGELHMAPLPTSMHGRRGLDLCFGLKPIADRRGLMVWPDQTGMFGVAGSNTNYRVPDGSLTRPDQVSERGLESAELVIEMLSPHDESRAKFPFYAIAGVREIWLIEPRTRSHEVHALMEDGYQRIEAREGVTQSPALGIELSIVDGKLRLRDGDYVVDV
jgi:Uma2 family endonuclease